MCRYNVVNVLWKKFSNLHFIHSYSVFHASKVEGMWGQCPYAGVPPLHPEIRT
jgi:hypothetical protein